MNLKKTKFSQKLVKLGKCSWKNKHLMKNKKVK